MGEESEPWFIFGLSGETEEEKMAEHLCPVWVGYLLASPLRKLVCSPSRILGPHVDQGMTVMDVGCAMGFFSLPMAGMVGARGRVVCLDVQEKMLKRLEARVSRAGVEEVVESRLCEGADLLVDDLEGEVDFALAFAMVHEAGDPARILLQIHSALRDGGRLLIAEPRGHVSDAMFADTMRWSREAGFSVVGAPEMGKNHSVLLEKPAAA